MNHLFRRELLLISSLLVLLVCPLFLQAGQPIVLTTDKIYILETPYIDLFVDSTRHLGIEDVSTKKNYNKFSPVQKYNPQNTELSFSYWLRFTVQNKSDIDRWLLEIPEEKADTVEVFVPTKDGGFESFLFGDAFRFDRRDYKFRSFIKGVTIPKDTSLQTYYIRFSAPHKIILLAFIKSPKVHFEEAISHLVFLWVFYGIVFALVAYNFLLFLAVRDRTYFLYVLYLLSIAFYSFADSGLGFQYFWKEYPSFNNIALPLSTCFLVVMTLSYSISFLELKKRLPLGYKLFLILIIVRIIFLTIELTFNIQSSNHPFVNWMPLVLAYIVGIVSMKRGYTPAIYFVLAFSFLLTGFIISLYKIDGVFSNVLLNVYSINIGGIFDILFLSLGLSERMSLIKKKGDKAQRDLIEQLGRNETLHLKIIEELKAKEELKEKVNRELEQRVRERTTELTKANEEISRMNSLLNADNHQLEKNVSELSKARAMYKKVSLDEFKQIYPDEASCYEYINEIKWANGFKCRKCGYQKYKEGKTAYSRRCSKCGYEESSTAFTLFHRLKFPINKAFYIVFLMTSEKKITIDELSSSLELRRVTCWSFKQKLQKHLNRYSPKDKASLTDLWRRIILENSSE